MDFKMLLKKGLLGYQPIFFPNGVITGTGYQFFGNFRKTSESAVQTDVGEGDFADTDSIRFNPKRLGNLYVPPGFGSAAEFNSDCYYCISDEELPQFVSDNLLMKRVYEYFVTQTLEAARTEGCTIDSMIEIGSNTCLFPLEFSRHGVRSCHGADIVNYSDVVAVLAELNDAPVSFHHMGHDTDETWAQLPKADLVWSYAVLIHQANPLVHLTRLASLARKAIFVMTNCGDEHAWGSPNDMAIKFQSANSYYAAAFPSCFDVTIVSPELMRFSLQRLGFSRILELPCPVFEHSSETESESLNVSMKMRRCFLAFRDVPLSDADLDDYSVETERSPYNGQDIRVHRGYHNNIFLRDGRYFIVPHGQWISTDHEQLRSFGNLSRAISYLGQLEEELSPFPVPVRELDGHTLTRFRNDFYLCPTGAEIDFDRDSDREALHLLDSLEKWTVLLSRTSIWSLSGQEWVIRDLINDLCMVRFPSGQCAAYRIRRDGVLEEATARASSLADLRRQLIVGEILGTGMCVQKTPQLHFSADGKALEHGSDGFVVRSLDSGEVLSTHARYEDAWQAFLGQACGRIGS